jgi:Tfp pilus assembly protein PilE
MSTADEIAKLARLKEQGTLTEEEFEREKHAILARGEGAAAPPQKTKTSGLAILAIVLAVLFFIPFMPLIGALLGLVALARLKARPHLGGRGAAIAAIIAGFVIFFFVQAMMGAIAIPAFIKYIRKSKTIEAMEGLDKLRAGAKMYYQSEHYDKNTGDLLPKRFPPGDAAWTPATDCCAQGQRCFDLSAWNKAPWIQLHFALADPHYFQYRFKSSGTNTAAKATLEARADLDCDGVYSSYLVELEVDEENGIQARGPIITDELE